MKIDTDGDFWYSSDSSWKLIYFRNYRTPLGLIAYIEDNDRFYDFLIEEII